MANAGDPVGARAGRQSRAAGRQTSPACTDFARAKRGKRLELLKEAVPKASRALAFMPTCRDTAWNASSDSRGPGRGSRRWELKLEAVEARRVAGGFGGCLSNAQSRSSVPTRSCADVVAGSLPKEPGSSELAVKNRLPAMLHRTEFVDLTGGLMAYGPSLPITGDRRAATYVDKILEGSQAGRSARCSSRRSLSS